MNFGVNDIARKVKDVEFGVNEIARKVKKGYIGVNGVAQQFYSAERLIPFTSNPVPTKWEDSSDYLSATATNEYGEWSVNATSVDGYYTRVSNAFDTSSDTAYKTKQYDSINQARYLYLAMPTGVSIKPTSILVKHVSCGSADYPAYLQAYDGYNWANLAKLESINQQYQQIINVSSETYYKNFRLLLYARTTGLYPSQIYNFEIQSGTLKINN